MLKTADPISFSFVEQRKSPRLPCFLPVTRECREKYGFHHIADISLDGFGLICLAQPNLPADDEMIQLQFYLPGHLKPFELLCQKVYATEKYVGLKIAGTRKSSQKPLKEFYLQLNEAKVLEEGIPSYTVTPPAKTPEPVSLNGGNVQEKARDPFNGSDKRKTNRNKLSQTFQIELHVKGRSKPVQGVVLDESRHGVSFEYEYNPGIPLSFGKGTVFSDGVIRGKDKTVRTGSARVCHVTPLNPRNGKSVIKVGLSIGERQKKTTCSVEKGDPKKINVIQSNGAGQYHYKGVAQPFIVKFKNESGEEIVGLLNTTFGEKAKGPVPVIVVPPGYAQHKESASLLTQILLHTFLNHKKEVAILRFDFTRSLGESFTDLEGDKEGSEYLTFTFSKAIEDTKAALKYAGKNSHFSASQILFLSSGFASPVVRRLLAESAGEKVSYWLNYFGITDPADWMLQITEGNDYFGNYLRGCRSGVVPFPQSLLNIDRVNEDLYRHRLALFEDAKRDMTLIGVPVTWICGENDSVVPVERVNQLMKTAAPAPRKMIRLSAAQLHFQHVRATPSFYIVAREIYFHLFRKKVSPSVPDPSFFKELNQREWSRLK